MKTIKFVQLALLILFAPVIFAQSVCVPTVVISATAKEICSGESVKFTAQTTKMGDNPKYHWYMYDAHWNYIEVGDNSPEFTFTSTVGGDRAVKVLVESSAACRAEDTTTSKSVWLRINSVPDLNLTLSPEYFCETSNTFVAESPENKGLFNAVINYNWYMNGKLIEGHNEESLNLYTQGYSNCTSLYVEATTTSACASVKSQKTNVVIYDPTMCSSEKGNSVDENIEGDSRPKTIVKIYNWQGEEVTENYSGLVIYRYSDGSVRKVLQE